MDFLTTKRAAPCLLSPSDEARLYRHLRTTILKTTLRELFATARLRVTLAVIMSLIIWIALFFIMYEGFMFLEREAGAFTQETIEKVFNIFYAFINMLVFSLRCFSNLRPGSSLKARYFW